MNGWLSDGENGGKREKTKQIIYRERRVKTLSETAGERREERTDKIETEGRKCMAGHE